MTSATHDPLRLNGANFAADAQVLEGDWAIADLPRLADSECPVDAGASAAAAAAGAAPPLTAAAADPARRVRWRAVGSLRPLGGEKQVWLSLEADADVVLQC